MQRYCRELLTARNFCYESFNLGFKNDVFMITAFHATSKLTIQNATLHARELPIQNAMLHVKSYHNIQKSWTTRNFTTNNLHWGSKNNTVTNHATNQQRRTSTTVGINRWAIQNAVHGAWHMHKSYQEMDNPKCYACICAKSFFKKNAMHASHTHVLIFEQIIRSEFKE